MQAVVLMGGEATRLRPLTLGLPKAMLPVLNTPFLAHLLDYLQKQGVSEVILALGFKSPLIEGYIAQRQFSVRVRCVTETSPLGTAGAVRNLSPYLEQSFFVLNGDIFTDLDLKDMLQFHRQRRSQLTIALTPVADPSSFGVVNTDDQGRITSFVEKPLPGTETSNNINAGVYLLEAETLRGIPPGHYMFERGLFPDLVSRGEPVFGYIYSGYFIDMGTPENYLKLNHDLLHRQGEKPVSLRGVELQGPVLLGRGVTVEPGAKLIGPTVLGPGCHIGAGSVIEGSVLWEGVRLGLNVEVTESVIAAHSLVGDSCHLERCVLGSGCQLSPGECPEPGTRVGPELKPQLQALF